MDARKGPIAAEFAGNKQPHDPRDGLRQLARCLGAQAAREHAREYRQGDPLDSERGQEDPPYGRA